MVHARQRDIANLKEECLVEDGVESFAMNLCLVFLLLWHQIDLHVRVRCARHVHSR